MFSVNIPNQGQAPYLPKDAILECNAVALGDGFMPVMADKLPDELVAKLKSKIAAIEITVDAALKDVLLDVIVCRQRLLLLLFVGGLHGGRRRRRASYRGGGDQWQRRRVLLAVALCPVCFWLSLCAPCAFLSVVCRSFEGHQEKRGNYRVDAPQ